MSYALSTFLQSKQLKGTNCNRFVGVYFLLNKVKQYAQSPCKSSANPGNCHWFLEDDIHVITLIF